MTKFTPVRQAFLACGLLSTVLSACSGDTKTRVIAELGAETVETTRDVVTVTHKQARGDLIRPVGSPLAYIDCFTFKKVFSHTFTHLIFMLTRISSSKKVPVSVKALGSPPRLRNRCLLSLSRWVSVHRLLMRTGARSLKSSVISKESRSDHRGGLFPACLFTYLSVIRNRSWM